MYVENPGPARQNQCKKLGYLCKELIDGTLIIDSRETSVKKTNLSIYPITNFYSWVIDKDTVRFSGSNSVTFTSYVRSKSDDSNMATVFDFKLQKYTPKLWGRFGRPTRKGRTQYKISIKDETRGFAERYPLASYIECNSTIVLPNGAKINDICKQLRS